MRYIPHKQKLYLPALMLIAASFVRGAVSLAQEAQAPVFPIKHLATLQAKDREPIVRPETQPQFEVLEISKDGAAIFFKVQRVEPLQDPQYYRTAYSLQAVDLESGNISVIGRFDTVGGMDWHDQSVASEKQSSVRSSTATNGEKEIQIGGPLPQAPAKDPLESLLPDRFKGELVYPARVHVKEPKSYWQRFLVVRSVGISVGNSQAVLSYPVTTSTGVFSPRYSPNGEYVALKVGQAGSRYDRYNIYLWHHRIGQLRQGPKEPISYPLFQWSPDSKFIAYVTGADASGEPMRNQPIQLHAYDLQTDKSRVLARSKGVTDFAWSHQGSILYTMLPELKEAADNAQAQQTARPSIYEVPVGGGTPKLVVQNAYTPAPSADNRWIAFLGWPDVQENKKEERSKVNRPGLYLLNRQDNKKVLVKANLRRASLFWTPDSKRLIVVEAEYDTKAAQGEARISTLSISSE